MVELAARRAGAHGVDNAPFRQADAQVEDFRPGTFDVAISRFGTMFFADSVTAFRNIASALRPGGRMHVVTWRPLVENEWLLVPGAALLAYGSLPDTAGPTGMFAQSDPDVIQSVLSIAGFGRCDIRPEDVRVCLGPTPREAADYLSSSGVGRAVLETVPDDRREEVLAAVEAALAERSGPDGVVLGAALWVTSATVPG